jgi:hypothetical protein
MKITIYGWSTSLMAKANTRAGGSSGMSLNMDSESNPRSLAKLLRSAARLSRSSVMGPPFVTG